MVKFRTWQAFFRGAVCVVLSGIAGPTVAGSISLPRPLFRSRFVCCHRRFPIMVGRHHLGTICFHKQARPIYPTRVVRTRNNPRERTNKQTNKRKHVLFRGRDVYRLGGTKSRSYIFDGKDPISRRSRDQIRRRTAQRPASSMGRMRPVR